jgi:hypothetical protein
MSAPVYTDAVELDEASRQAYEDACDVFEQRQLRIEEERFRVSQKIEQLKTVAELAAIIGGFGAMYLAQTTIPTDKLIDNIVLVAYGSLATVVVCLLQCFLLNSLKIQSMIFLRCLFCTTFRSARTLLQSCCVHSSCSPCSISTAWRVQIVAIPR